MNNQKIKNISKQLWGSDPAGMVFGKEFEKGSKNFFERVLEKRFLYECQWLNEIVDFSRFNKKNILEIGCGAGYDAYQFCKNGAFYTGIDLTPENILLAKKHLFYYGFMPTILELDVEKMNFDSLFDFIFSFGVLHHTPSIIEALKGIHRALKMGGEAQIIVYHKNSIFYRIHLFLFDWILRGKFLKMSFKKRLSQIEFTTLDVEPLVNVYSKKELILLMESTGFKVIKIDIRKLNREDLPLIPFVEKLYKYIPDSLLYFFSKKWGWYLSVRAIKQ